MVCEKCGHTMTIIKGKPNKGGETRRYFNCTGKSHMKICKGPKVSIYAEDLENMVYDCIAEKIKDLKSATRSVKRGDSSEINNLKLKSRLMRELNSRSNETDTVVNLARLWQNQTTTEKRLLQ